MQTHKQITIILLLHFIILTSFNSNCFSQDTPFQNVIPASPSTAALMKFNDTPVSYFTGLPQIEIPLYDLQGGSINLPIRLSYHASGIKIDEKSGWVGMNWALNAGGAISRTVMGSVDEGSSGYTKFSKNIPDWITLPYFNRIFSADSLYQLALCEGYDSEPDVFSYNFGNHSGKFILTSDKKGNTTAQTIPHSNLKIVPKTIHNQQKIDCFEVTDEKGFTYVFGYDGERYAIDVAETELSINTYSNSAWQLLDIISPSKADTVKFTYSIDEESSTSEYQYIDSLVSFNGSSVTAPWQNYITGSV